MRDHSDSLIGRLFGIAIARRAAVNECDLKRAKFDRRKEDWRMAQYREITKSRPQTISAAISSLLDSTDISEMDMMDIVIEGAGLSLEPPSDWDSGYRFPDETEPSAAQPR